MRPEAEISYSLAELSAEVAAALSRAGLLGAAPDARVSAAPDARTVRYYTTLGLLDRPSIVGRQARYGQRHLLQLLAIKGFQVRGLPLAEIQERLYGRSDAELQGLIEALESEPVDPPAAPPGVSVREVTIEPGLRLLVEEGYRPGAGAETKIRAALAALSRDPEPGRGGSA
ncbi:MAG: MerR family transcriptional regulator [Myxococcales bacterium]